MCILKLAIVGIGGFGKSHLNMIRHFEDNGKVKLVACCDKNLNAYKDNLKQCNFNDVRTYEDYEVFINSEKALDLVVIATPILLHKSMCCRALEQGNNVLLEKPPSVTVQDVEEMIKMQRKTNKTCAVGFQMVYDKSFKFFMEQLKAGIVGRINKISAEGQWRRELKYFKRSPWVGRLLYNGNYVLDGSINNSLAHLLNNCLVISALQNHGKELPLSVKAELYKANNIEGEDTSCLKIITEGGVEILYFSTLCHKSGKEPLIMVEGTLGKAFWSYNGTVEIVDLKEIYW